MWIQLKNSNVIELWCQIVLNSTKKCVTQVQCVNVPACFVLCNKSEQLQLAVRPSATHTQHTTQTLNTQHTHSTHTTPLFSSWTLSSRSDLQKPSRTSEPNPHWYLGLNGRDVGPHTL